MILEPLLKVPLYHLPPATATCEFLDGPCKGRSAEVTELSAAGARVICPSTAGGPHYANCLLHLTDTPWPLFVCLLGGSGNSLKLRWLHWKLAVAHKMQRRLASRMPKDWQSGETTLHIPQRHSPQPPLPDPLSDIPPISPEIPSSATPPAYIDILEGKVRRLANSLEEAESVIAALRREATSGQAPVSLPEKHPLDKAKNDLLRALFQENLTLRQL